MRKNIYSRLQKEPTTLRMPKKSKEHTDSGGESFHFKLPKEGLALSRVVLLGHCVQLMFRAAFKVPTLTEQLVAAVMRLVYVDKTRPEFYYIPIPYGHPYHGRQYKQYKPQWLRGTPLGDILAEADWKMKCLHVGARSDDAKEKFEAWSNKSQLTGLATRMDFPPDERPSGRSIIMSCESAKVHETETELVFIEEPKMKIEDQTNTTWSSYITHYFDSVAYHDEPLFLQMKEIVKLIIAVEWMGKRGVKANKSWMWDCTKSQGTSIPISIKPHPEQLKKMLASWSSEHTKALQSHDKGTMSHYTGALSHDTSTQLEVTDNTGIATVTRCIGDITETWTLKISDDRDLVFSHLNPQMPLGINRDMRPLIPDVTSWKELFAETVPWPHVWQGRREVCTFTGGVTTRDIPIHHTPAAATPSSSREVGVASSTARNATQVKVGRKDIPKQDVVPSPPSDVPVRSNERAINDRMAPSRTIGYSDGATRSQYTPNGSPVQQTASVPASLTRTVARRRQTVREQTVIGSVPVPAPENSCVVCHDELGSDVAGLPCSHTFHQRCIDQWLQNHNTCPMCRTEVGPSPGQQARDAVQTPSPQKTS